MTIELKVTLNLFGQGQLRKQCPYEKGALLGAFFVIVKSFIIAIEGKIMTVAAIWVEDDFLWCVADTRISSPGQNGQIVKTDKGSKIFPLHMKCSSAPSDPNIIPAPFFHRTYGICFSGDTLPALMTISTANALLNQLYSPYKIQPTIKQIAEYIQFLGTKFSKDVLSAHNGKLGKFECAIMGCCPHSNKFEVFHLVPTQKTGEFKLLMHEYSEDSLQEHPVVLGSGKTELLNRLQKQPIGSRAPKSVIQNMAGENNGDIGGSISQGLSSRENFRLFWAASPPDSDGKSGIIYNGIDLTNLMQIGGSYVGMPGLA